MDNLPDSGVEYNARAMEMLCCNGNGMIIDAWYGMPVGHRTMKVAAMILPILISSLQSMEERRLQAAAS